MDTIRDALTQRVGPFAVWQWGAIVAAGVLLSMLLRRAFVDGGSAAPEDTPPALGGGSAASTPLVVPSNVASPPPGTATREPEAPDTNEAWVSYASGLLRDEGTFDAVAIDQALRKYVYGDELTEDQARIVDHALRAAGTPPEGAPPIRLAVPEDDPTVGELWNPTPTGQVGEVGGDRAFTGSDLLVRSRVALIRANRGLPPDPESDRIWVERIEAGTHTIGDARTAIEGKASEWQDDPTLITA